jgi:hypothetical protein
MSQPLSPAAQAALDVVCANTEPDCDTQHLIAAALRAAADQSENLYDPHEGKVSGVRVEKLLAIATELEGHL